MRLGLGLGVNQQVKNNASSFTGLPLTDFPTAYSGISTLNLGGPETRAIRAYRTDDVETEADFTPTEIADGTLTAWASGGTANTLNHAYVLTAYDQSGNLNHANGVKGSCPKVVDAGVLCVGSDSKPTFKFDGAEELIITEGPLGASGNFANQAFTGSYFIRGQMSNINTSFINNVLFHQNIGVLAQVGVGFLGGSLTDGVRLHFAGWNTIESGYKTERARFLTPDLLYTFALRGDFDGGGTTEGVVSNARLLEGQTIFDGTGANAIASNMREQGTKIRIGVNRDVNGGNTYYLIGAITTFICFNSNVGTDDLIINQQITDLL